MARDRPGPDRDRLLAARLAGVANRHARFSGLTEAERTAGATELRAAVGGRGDLLAEVAGLAIGTAEARGEEYTAREQAIAELCRLAGADESVIGQWAEEGGRPVAIRRKPRSVTRLRVHRRGPERALGPRRRFRRLYGLRPACLRGG